MLLLLPCTSNSRPLSAGTCRASTKSTTTTGTGQRTSGACQPASTATCSVKCHIMSQLHLVPLPQEHAASIQPLDPDLLEGQASYLRHSSVFFSPCPLAVKLCHILLLHARRRVMFCFVSDADFALLGSRRRLDRPPSTAPPTSPPSSSACIFAQQPTTLLPHTPFFPSKIHTAYETQAFGAGNCFAEGISRFLSSHRCNEICHYLGLPPTSQPAKHSSEGCSPLSLSLLWCFHYNVLLCCPMQMNKISDGTVIAPRQPAAYAAGGFASPPPPRPHASNGGMPAVREDQDLIQFS
jgi:hypothetical protein